MTGKQTVKKIWRVISDMQTRKENQKKISVHKEVALEKLFDSEISLPPKWNFQLIFASAYIYILTIASRNLCRSLIVYFCLVLFADIKLETTSSDFVDL